ncbi:hypothetical protein EXIGLDRAFT_669778 [Exidia glandulosa HHB12029]|uniref:Vacuolar-sorting protein SNF7 n=1 Tax=Exidia glandulosa HHB12029 TaxID=1314781 RepID=A0A165LJ27_EXIGL|nr:hypothetical protein EXIGLDRAFT_669778 [Exidia glandulosa HHB12029]
MDAVVSFFGGRRDPRAAARDAIVSLRTQLTIVEKKADFLTARMDEQLAIAKANAVTDKSAGMAALRRRKMFEKDLTALDGMRVTLESQIQAIESANLNAETMHAMRKAAEAMKIIHGTLNIGNVERTMDSLNEQTQLAEDISAAITELGKSSTVDIDEDDLARELEALETEQLDMVLPPSTTSVPAVALPSAPTERITDRQAREETEELERMLAQLAM